MADTLEDINAAYEALCNRVAEQSGRLGVSIITATSFLLGVEKMAQTGEYKKLALDLHQGLEDVRYMIQDYNNIIIRLSENNADFMREIQGLLKEIENGG